MQTPEEKESEAAKALGYDVNKHIDNELSNMLKGPHGELVMTSTRAYNEKVLIDPGTYYWKYTDKMDWKRDKRTFEVMDIAKVLPGEVFSGRCNGTIEYQNKYIMLDNSTSGEIHDSRAISLFAVNIATGKQLAVQDVDYVTRYRPTKKEAIGLIPYTA